MEARSSVLVLAVLSFPWWSKVLLSLCREVYSAATPPAEPIERPRALARTPRLPSRANIESRTPLNRILAFRGLEQRTRERSRWQGGFGRRGM